MARSLVGGITAGGYDQGSITVSDSSYEAREFVGENFQVCVTDDNEQTVSQSTIVVLAVKPQVLRDVLIPLQNTFQQYRPLLISIAAGIRLRELDSWSNANLAIVRVMPNTPALIQQGISGMYANERVTSEQKNHAESIMSAVGRTLWLLDESDIDAVTAVSGSGPAYFFYLIEALEQAATNLGLTVQTAKELALQTAVGASQLAAKSGEPAAELRKRVTSPGGVTEAALRELESAGVKDRFVQAIAAGQRRSVELSEILADSN